MLYLVPTPIGNLEDITLRAIRVLKEVDLIACEDTRSSGILLSHYDIKTPRTSFHEHNESTKTPVLIDRLESGESIALISDAGSPGISDPGFSLVRACIDHGITVQALPGATALIPALVASGLPTHRFAFEGFLPHKKGRKSKLEIIAQEPRTIVLYESPHRLLRTLRQLAEILEPNRQIVAVREISKKFEEIQRGTPGEVLSYFASLDKIRGEFVLVIEGCRDN